MSRDFPDDLSLVTVASDSLAMQTILPSFGCSARGLQVPQSLAEARGRHRCWHSEASEGAFSPLWADRFRHPLPCPEIRGEHGVI